MIRAHTKNAAGPEGARRRSPFSNEINATGEDFLLLYTAPLFANIDPTDQERLLAEQAELSLQLREFITALRCRTQHAASPPST